MKINIDYINVPVELCLFSLRDKKTSQVRLYLFFKSISSGFIPNSSNTIHMSAEILNVCERTVKNHLYWLIEERWLIHYPETNSFRVIGFKPLAVKLSFRIASGGLLYKNEILKYKAFASALVITYYMMRIKRRKRLTEFKKGSSSSHDLPPYPHLPHLYLAKVLGVTKSSAATYRKLAIKSGYLIQKCQFEDLKIPVDQLGLIKSTDVFDNRLLKKINNSVHIQLPDKIESQIHLRTKWELRSICQKNNMEKNSTD